MGEIQVEVERRRIGAIDAARGSAMLCVFLSHFVEVYFHRHGLATTTAYMVTMFASPAFISISGVMLAVLYRTRKERFQTTKSRFIRRGLFLLTAGRVLIYLAHIPFAGGFAEALRWGFMTDTIALCIILGPLVIEHWGMRMRLWTGVAIVLLSWVAVQFWVPEGIGATAWKEILVGPFGSATRFFADIFPVVPWFGLYLAATSAGEYLAELLAAGKRVQATKALLWLGTGGIVAAAVLVAVRLVLHRVGEGMPGAVGDAFLFPFQKLPPSPTYLLFYAGCAALLLFALMQFESARVVKAYSQVASVLGRTSLFMFILQYVVYFGVLALVDVGPASLWPLYFAASAAAMWGVGVVWDRLNLNRYLIVPEFRSAPAASR
jgi:uncharacterized membrane protein